MIQKHSPQPSESTVNSMQQVQNSASRPRHRFLPMLICLLFIPATALGAIAMHPAYIDSVLNTYYDSHNYYPPMVHHRAYALAVATPTQSPVDLKNYANLVADAQKQRQELMKEIIRNDATPLPVPNPYLKLNEQFTIGGIEYSVEGAEVDTERDTFGASDDGGKYILIHFDA